MVLVVVIDVDQIADLAAEGRSSVAAKDQDQRARADVVADAEGRTAVKRVERSVGGRIAHMQIPAMPLRQRIAQKPVQVARAAHKIAADAHGDRQKRDEDDYNPLYSTHLVFRERKDSLAGLASATSKSVGFEPLNAEPGTALHRLVREKKLGSYRNFDFRPILSACGWRNRDIVELLVEHTGRGLLGRVRLEFLRKKVGSCLRAEKKIGNDHEEQGMDCDPL